MSLYLIPDFLSLDVKTAVKNKVPLVRSLTLNWLTFCIETSNKSVIQKIHKDYVPICMEVSGFCLGTTCPGCISCGLLKELHNVILSSQAHNTCSSLELLKLFHKPNPLMICLDSALMMVLLT